MHRKLKLASSPTCPCGQEEQTTEHVLQRCLLYKATIEDVLRVACQHFPDDQTLWLQTGSGEDDIIHLPSGLDRVDSERQEEEEEEEEVGFESWHHKTMETQSETRLNVACKGTVVRLTKRTLVGLRYLP